MSLKWWWTHFMISGSTWKLIKNSFIPWLLSNKVIILATQFSVYSLLQWHMRLLPLNSFSPSYRYFSYEHFYVIYCKFWELDTDHDFFIDKENLIRYGNHALTYRIVDRIFSQVCTLFNAHCVNQLLFSSRIKYSVCSPFLFSLSFFLILLLFFLL